MRTTSLKTVYLAEEELKQAVANFIRDRDGTKLGLYTHLMNNACEMEWTQDGGEFLISMDGEIKDNIMTKDEPGEQDISPKQWVVKVEHLDATDPDSGGGELCIRFPDELAEQLGWEIGDEIKWEDTEICEDWGEHKGFTLSNLTKHPYGGI
jgi:hypothetical protein